MYKPTEAEANTLKIIHKLKFHRLINLDLPDTSNVASKSTHFFP